MTKAVSRLKKAAKERLAAIACCDALWTCREFLWCDIVRLHVLLLNLSKRRRSLCRSVTTTALSKMHHPGRHFWRRKIYVGSNDQRKLWFWSLEVTRSCPWDALLSQTILPPQDQGFAVTQKEENRLCDGNFCALSKHLIICWKEKYVFPSGYGLWGCRTQFAEQSCVQDSRVTVLFSLSSDRHLSLLRSGKHVSLSVTLSLYVCLVIVDFSLCCKWSTRTEHRHVLNSQHWLQAPSWIRIQK